MVKLLNVNVSKHIGNIVEKYINLIFVMVLSVYLFINVEPGIDLNLDNVKAAELRHPIPKQRPVVSIIKADLWIGYLDSFFLCCPIMQTSSLKHPLINPSKK